MVKKQYTIGAIISYLTIVFNIATGLLYTPWMINIIGKEQYGLYTLVSSIIAVFLLDFGISSAVTKFLSQYNAEKSYEKISVFLGVLYKLFFIISAIIALVLFIYYFFIESVYTGLTIEEIIVFKRLFIIVAVFSVLSFSCMPFNGVLMANEKFIEVKLCGLFQHLLAVVLTIIALIFNYGIYALVFIKVCSNLLFNLIKYIIIKRKTNSNANLKLWDRDVAKNIFSYSIWITIENIAGRFILNIMPTIIAIVVNSSAVTIFSLALTLEGYVFNFSYAINGMFMPKITNILVQENEEMIMPLMIKVGRYHIATLGLLFIGFICVGQEFILLWMGRGYADVYICALLLIVPSIFRIPQQVANTTLYVKNKVKEKAIIYLCISIFNICMAFLFLNIFGITGAAISIMLSYLIDFVSCNILYKKYIKINLTQYFINTYARWIIVAAISFIVGFFIVNRISINGLFGFCIKVLIITIVYCTLYLIICMNKKEIKSILSKFHIKK